MSFEFFSVSFIAMLVGLVVCFSGYHFVPVLLAAWGFLVGYTLGNTAMHLLLGVGPRANLIGWGIGLLAAGALAMLAYRFVLVEVILAAGALGHTLGVGFFFLIGLHHGWKIELVGILAGTVLIVGTHFLDWRKAILIIATAVGGARIIVGTLMLAITKATWSDAVQHPMVWMWQGGLLWALSFLVLAGLGITVQRLMITSTPN